MTTPGGVGGVEEERVVAVRAQQQIGSVEETPVGVLAERLQRACHAAEPTATHSTGLLGQLCGITDDVTELAIKSIHRIQPRRATDLQTIKDRCQLRRDRTTFARHDLATGPV